MLLKNLLGDGSALPGIILDVIQDKREYNLGQVVGIRGASSFPGNIIIIIIDTHQNRCKCENEGEKKIKREWRVVIPEQNSGLLDSIPSPTEGLRAPGPTTETAQDRVSCKTQTVQYSHMVNEYHM